MIDITFLGTACQVPTKDRNVQGIFMSYKTDGILIDCGEGSQRQMNLAGINRNKVSIILITHWHGDHVGGLAPLLQTVSDKDNPPKIEIIGPKGTKKSIDQQLDSLIFDKRNLDLTIKEFDPSGIEVCKETFDYTISCTKMDHGAPCLAYSFKEKDTRKVNLKKAKDLGLKEGPEIGKLSRGQNVKIGNKTIKPDDISTIKKGKKITFVFDTQPCKNAIDIAADSDLLITEAVYLPDCQEQAEKYKHLTTQDSGYIANQAGVKELIITHYSQRYATTEKLEEDIQKYFSNSRASYDLMKIKI